MNIDTENLQFLDGYLNALSSVDGDTGEYTMTAIVIDALSNNLALDIANFYELPYDDSSIESNRIEFYSIEKIIDSKILRKPFNNLINCNKNRNKLLSYKIMDYIQYCFNDFSNLDTNDMEVFHIKINFKGYKTEFLAIPIDDKKNFIISFWHKFNS